MTPSPEPTPTPDICNCDGFSIKAEGACPPVCKDKRVKTKRCFLKGESPGKILFIQAYDYDRQKVDSEGKPVDSRDVELAFIINGYGDERIKTEPYFAGDKFLQNINITGNATVSGRKKSIDLNNPRTEDSIIPNSDRAQELFENDQLTDAVYNNNRAVGEIVPYFSTLPGTPTQLLANNSLLFVSANLSKLDKNLTQDIVVNITSVNKKETYTLKLRLIPSFNGIDNWESIECVN